MEEKGMQQGQSLSSPELMEIILVVMYKVVLRGKNQSVKAVSVVIVMSL